MSELPDLPPPPRRSRPVPDGGLDAVLAAGRARRTRGAAAATTTALALVVAGVLVQPTAALQSLNAAFRPGPAASPERTQVPPPRPTTAAPTVAPTTEPSTGSPPEAAEQQEQAAADDSPRGDRDGPPAAPPSAPASARPTPSPSTAAGPTPTPAAPATPAAEVLPAFREDTDEDASGTVDCAPEPVAQDGRGEGGAPCAYETSSGRTAKRGEQVTVSYGQCSRAPVVTVFTFGGGQEKEVVVTAVDGQEVFRFSETVRYPQGAHERRLRPGSCIEWTGRWDLVTTRGEPVPAGTYRMTTTVSADRVQTEGADDAASRDLRASSSVTVQVLG